MEKNTKRQKEQRARQEEAILNRIMAWLAGGVVLEFLLLLLNWRYGYADTWQFVQVTIRVLAVAGLACAAAGAIWLRAAARNKAGILLPAVCTLFSAGVGLSCLATWAMGRVGLHFAYVALPVLVALVLIYYLYQREFFFQACGSVLALLGIWLASSGTGSTMGWLTCGYAVLAALVLLCGALLCRRAQKGMGKVTLAGKTWRLLGKRANYGLLYLGAAVDALVVALALTPVPPLVLYGAVTAWLLVLAVYYTVKLM